MTPGACLVTGAAKRLGRAIALDLAAQGWSVAIHCHASRDAAEETAEAARKAGAPQVAVLPADLLDVEACRALVGRAVEALGPLTLLVNNASIFEPDTLASATPESWERHIGSNLRAPFWLIQSFAAQAPKAGRDGDGQPVARACVVNMIDQRVWRPAPDFMTYGLAKAGLYWLTQTAAQALAPDVRVAGIGPGPSLIGVRQRPAHFQAQRDRAPLGRGAEPAEITQALRFILSAPSLTGQMIALDGGTHLGWDSVGLES